MPARRRQHKRSPVANKARAIRGASAKMKVRASHSASVRVSTKKCLNPSSLLSENRIARSSQPMFVAPHAGRAGNHRRGIGAASRLGNSIRSIIQAALCLLVGAMPLFRGGGIDIVKSDRYPIFSGQGDDPPGDARCDFLALLLDVAYVSL